MTASNHDPQGVYVISRGGILHGVAAADDPVVQWLWSQLSLGGTVDPLDPPPLHRLALGYPRSAVDGGDGADHGGDPTGDSGPAGDPGDTDAAA